MSKFIALLNKIRSTHASMMQQKRSSHTWFLD